jgi:alpha-acetolactate decarboxylase
MHDVMGEGHSEGRVQLAKLTSKPHMYAVAALEGLKGEITLFDSSPTVTDVSADSQLAAVDEKDAQATLLVGAYVSSWKEQSLAQATPAENFDKTMRDEGSKAGLDVSKPFVFRAEGEFTNVRVHVLNGACPMHAKMMGIEIPKDKQPYESEYKTIRGKLVGIYAENSVGTLTHPGQSTHVHLIYKDPSSGRMVTAHVEKIGLPKGAVIDLPQ